MKTECIVHACTRHDKDPYQPGMQPHKSRAPQKGQCGWYLSLHRLFTHTRSARQARQRLSEYRNEAHLKDSVEPEQSQSNNDCCPIPHQFNCPSLSAVARHMASRASSFLVRFPVSPVRYPIYLREWRYRTHPSTSTLQGVSDQRSQCTTKGQHQMIHSLNSWYALE